MNNLLQTLPITIIPMSKGPDYDKVLTKLEAVFAGNPALLRTARMAKHTELVVRMASHSNVMLCVKWTNPTNKKWLLVIALKSEYGTNENVARSLTGPLAEILAGWIP